MLMEVKNVSKKYGAFFALTGVDFEIFAGEVHALVGENGAGKSTLVKLMTGLEQPNVGELKWRGENYSVMTPHEAIADGVVAVQQELTIIETMTVSENIWLGHEPLKKSGLIDFKKMKVLSRDILKHLDFHIDVEAVASDLSLADKQLVEIAKAFSYKPKLLILDEATSAIGEKEVGTLLNVVKEFTQSGGAVIFISHRMKELFSFCDRCTILKDGKKIITEEIKKLDNDSIVKYMTGREINHGYFPKKKSAAELEKHDVVMTVNNLSTKSGVKNCSFAIRKGEVLGFGGLQGQGQIDVINALFGMNKITSGEIHMEGKKLKLSNPERAINSGILLVPQDRKKEGLFVEDSVANNLIAASLRKISSAGLIRNKNKTVLISDIVDSLSIKTSNSQQLAKSLSGGNQQKIVFGKWLANEAKILMLIEPTRGIDIATKMEIYRLIDDLKGKGYAIIVSTNELLELVGICDRVLVMYEKQVTLELTCDDITEERIVSASFGEAN